MTGPQHDPSVNNEPHFRAGPLLPDPSESQAAHDLNQVVGRPPRLGDPDQSAWDEPTLSRELVGDQPADAQTWAGRLEGQRARTSALRTWAATLLMALAAGPWAIAGALWASAGQGVGGLLLLAVLGPMIEETMKVAAALYVVERRPWLFRSPLQLALCALAGGLIFAAIENLLYLHVYVPDPSAALVRWRWTVCVALHTTCSFVTGLGLIRIWSDVWRRHDRPRTELMLPMWIAAVALHGLYNAAVTLVPALQQMFSR
ncbi:MAG: hypothetical protein BIFFINMI_00355 [Phycisphaerae bacterium]|nr:hypothetical protein [Phycisphaerae bacterium]